MRTALDELGLDQAHDAQLWDYLVMAARMLVNQPSEHGGGRPDLGLTPQPAGRQQRAMARRAGWRSDCHLGTAGGPLLSALSGACGTGALLQRSSAA